MGWLRDLEGFVSVGRRADRPGMRDIRCAHASLLDQEFLLGAEEPEARIGESIFIASIFEERFGSFFES